jgi:preprotein translocase subunit SecB
VASRRGEADAPHSFAEKVLIVFSGKLTCGLARGVVPAQRFSFWRKNMTEANGNGAATEVAPQLNVIAQYTKDLSFENPNAPRSLAQQQGAPEISIQVNINLRQLAETDFEVELLLEGTAAEASNTLFKFDLNYAGVFRVVNIPEQDMHPILMIECPRLLFPFAREIIANAIRGGGFPPLLIDPIDFVGLYRQRMTEAQQATVS